MLLDARSVSLSYCLVHISVVSSLPPCVLCRGKGLSSEDIDLAFLCNVLQILRAHRTCSLSGSYRGEDNTDVNDFRRFLVFLLLGPSLYLNDHFL